MRDRVQVKNRRSECVPGTDRGMAGRGGQGGVGAVYRVGGRGLEAGGAGGRVCVERVYGRVGSQGAGVDINSWPELELFCHSLAWPAGGRRKVVAEEGPGV